MFCCCTCVGGIRPRCTAVEPKGEKVHSTNNRFPVRYYLQQSYYKFNVNNFWRGNSLTFTAHSYFEAFFQPAVLTLIPVMLINWTVSRCSARIRKITTNTTLEERLATFTSENSVMFSRGLVPTHSTFYLTVLFCRVFLSLCCLSPCLCGNDGHYAGVL